MMARNKTETKIRIKVPEDLSADQKFDVAIAVLQFIHDRTTEGKNVYGRQWAGKAGEYTKQYAKKKGVSPSGPVDLALSREMLGKMQYFSSLSKKGEIVVGFKDGTKAQKKAEGNIQGSYGRDPNPSKARPFLDILQKDVNAIVSEVTE
jgi:hypothetical protein